MLPCEPASNEMQRAIAENKQSSDALDGLIYHTHQLCDELAVTPAAVYRLIDSGLQLTTQSLTFQNVATTSPVVARVLQMLNAPSGPKTTRFLELVRTFAREFVAGEFSKFSVKVNETIMLNHLQTREFVEGALKAVADVANEVPASEDFVKQSAAMIAELKKLQTKVENTLREVAVDFEKIEGRMDELERKRLIKEDRPTNQKEVSAAELTKRARAAEVRRVPTPPPPPPPPKPQTKAAKPPKRKYRRRTKKPKAGPGRPKGSTDKKPRKIRESVAPSVDRFEKRAAALERSNAKTKKQSVAPKKPAAKPISSVSEIDRFMGNAKDPKIRALLGTLSKPTLAKFVKQSLTGIPDLDSTKWSPTDQGRFAQWYYGSARKR
jgi:hypothetical protein